MSFASELTKKTIYITMPLIIKTNNKVYKEILENVKKL